MDMRVFEVAAEGVVLPITHPITGEPLVLPDGTPVAVTVVGTDSKEWRAREREIANRRISGGSKRPITVEEIEEDALASIAAIIKSWTGIREGEKDYPCTTENKLLMLAKYPDFKRQIDGFLGKRENFLRVSQQS